MSITSVSSIVTRGGRVAVIADIPYAYYTFDQADVDGTNVLNRTSTFYDASLSTAGILDGSNNISGTTDLSLNSATSQFVTINSPMDIGKSTGLSILFGFGMVLQIAMELGFLILAMTLHLIILNSI